MAHKWADWLRTPAIYGVRNASERGIKSGVAHKCVDWPHDPCCLWGSPPLHSGGQNQKLSTTAGIGHITNAVWGVLDASQQGTKSEMPHKWADCLHNHCLLGSSQRFKAGDEIKSGPQVDWLYDTYRPRGPRALQRRGQNREGEAGFHLRGGGSGRTPPPPKKAQLTGPHISRHPGGPQRFRAGDKIKIGLQAGRLPT